MQMGCLPDRLVVSFMSVMALFKSKRSITIQKHHLYTGNVNSEMSGDRINAFLHCGDVKVPLQLVNTRPCSIVPNSPVQRE